MNRQLGSGQMAEAKAAYAQAAPPGHRASDCSGCRQCERACPQHLSIVDNLKRAVSLLEQADA